MLGPDVLVQVVLAQVRLAAQIAGEILPLDVHVHHVIPQTRLIREHLFANRAHRGLVRRVFVRTFPRRFLDDHVDDRTVTFPTVSVSVVVISVDDPHVGFQTLSVLQDFSAFLALESVSGDGFLEMRRNVIGDSHPLLRGRVRPRGRARFPLGRRLFDGPDGDARRVGGGVGHVGLTPVRLETGVVMRVFHVNDQIGFADESLLAKVTGQNLGVFLQIEVMLAVVGLSLQVVVEPQRGTFGESREFLRSEVVVHVIPAVGLQ